MIRTFVIATLVIVLSGCSFTWSTEKTVSQVRLGCVEGSDAYNLELREKKQLAETEGDIDRQATRRKNATNKYYCSSKKVVWLTVRF